MKEDTDRDPLLTGKMRGRLERLEFLARLALFWERLWPALWPAVGVGGIFLALALFDVLPGLPGWLHFLVLIAFLGLLGFALRRAVMSLAVPGAAASRRRLETKSGLEHRPLSVLGDELATGESDPEIRALWHLHRKRMFERLRDLRVGVPAAGLAKRDIYALRAALTVVLAIAAAAAWNDGASRLAGAVTPDFASFGAGSPATLDVWITPPAYTGLAPIFVKGRSEQKDVLAVPAGSGLLAQLHGGRGTPRLKIDDEATPFSAVDTNAYKITATIDDGDRLSVEQDGKEIAAWPLSVIPDTEPEVQFATAPTRTTRAALRLEYQAVDDYGIAGVKAFIRRTGPGAAHKGAVKTIVLDLPLPGTGFKKAKEASYHDLTAHPWAGLPVSVQLMANDGIGQIGVSQPRVMVLPERLFRHPVARAIIELRKRLSVDPDDRRPVMLGLYKLSNFPREYRHDTVVFLALRSARARLKYDHSEAAVPAVQSLLWDTALRLEDGKLSIAQRELRAAQRALIEALSRRASTAEIERLMDKLQTALNRFLESMLKNMQNMPNLAMPFDPSSRYFTPQDLQRMLDRARELARTGSLDAARQLLALMQELLENLRAGDFAMRPGGKGENKAWEMMRNLGDIMRRQQRLLDRSFGDSQKSLGQGTRPNTGGSAKEQEALRRGLGDLMRRLGEAAGRIPRAFGRAERSMRDAVEALRRNAPGQAVGPQSDALDQLQQGAGAMMKELMKRFGRGPGMARRGGRLMDRMNRAFDPLGRPMPNVGNFSGEDVGIPDEMEMQRAREILRELRRRAGEMDRPRLERDYLDRLLRRF